MRLFKIDSMAIINTLREKMGRLVVVVVGISILAFVLTDLASNQNLFGAGARNVGEIDGEEISQEEYAQLVENLKRYYGITTSNDQTMQFVRDQAWNQLVSDIAFTQKLEQLGLEIGTNERVDMVQGKNISPTILQFFQQRIGTADPTAIRQYLQSIEFDPNEQYIFASAEAQAMGQRRMNKFQNLITKTAYATLEEAKRAYQNELGFIDVDYVFVPFSTVSNDQIGAVSESEIRSYLSAHEDEFTVEETRAIDYVTFPVVPSAADTADYQQQMAEIKARFEDENNNDSTYAISITEQGLGFTTYDPTALPTAVASQLSTVKAGDIIGPDLNNGIFSIHKVVDVVPSENEFARVSQIVFPKNNLTPAQLTETKKTANDVLRQARGGADFAQLARQYSKGAFANTGGDMGWVRKGQSSIQNIESELFAARRTGVVNKLIESDNNIYIINVTETKMSNRYKVAQVIIEMAPSFETTNQVYLQAAEFAASAYGPDEFNSKAGEQGYSVFSGTGISNAATSIGQLSNARQVVSWLYGEAEMGDVKEFELEDQYVVAVYANRTPEGLRSFESARSEIEGIIRNEKKAEFIKSKLAAASGDVNAMGISSSYGPEAQVFNNPNLKMSDLALGQIGGDSPEAIGAAFALQNPGDKTAPHIVDEKGVVVVILKSKSTAAEIGDYTSYENQLINSQAATAAGKLQNSVIDKVDVEDQRYKFY